MTRRELMSAERLQEALDGLPGWSSDEKGLHRELRFPDFAAAFGFMCTVALIAQQLDHHPDWSNSYDVVRITLWTHDLGGISTRDVELAARIEAVAGGQTFGGSAAIGTPSAGN